MNRVDAIHTLMHHAHDWAQFSHCLRKQTAAIIYLRSDPAVQLALGLNGPGRRSENHCLRPDADGDCGCGHAEIAALTRMSFVPGSPPMAYGMVCTLAPCERCAVAITIPGTIGEFWYDREHSRGPAGLAILRTAGITAGHLSEIKD